MLNSVKNFGTTITRLVRPGVTAVDDVAKAGTKGVGNATVPFNAAVKSGDDVAKVAAKSGDDVAKAGVKPVKGSVADLQARLAMKQPGSKAYKGLQKQLAKAKAAEKAGKAGFQMDPMSIGLMALMGFPLIAGLFGGGGGDGAATGGVDENGNPIPGGAGMDPVAQHTAVVACAGVVSMSCCICCLCIIMLALVAGGGDD